jgi:hypothetical protein
MGRSWSGGGGGCQHTQSWLTHPHAHIGSSTQGVVSPAVSPDEEDADGPLPICYPFECCEDVFEDDDAQYDVWIWEFLWSEFRYQ